MNQEVAGLLLFIIVVGGSAALKMFSKGTTDPRKRSVKLTCSGSDCEHTLVITVENLHS